MIKISEKLALFHILSFINIIISIIITIIIVVSFFLITLLLNKTKLISIFFNFLSMLTINLLIDSMLKMVSLYR